MVSKDSRPGKIRKSLGLKSSTYYSLLKPAKQPKTTKRVKSRRALTDQEHREVVAVLHEERFMDKAPSAIYAALLDEGRYLCSIRTMYRILKSLDELKERRNQLRHPKYKKPELLATAPNQVWSWDISKMKGPVKWSHYYLYVILDIYSRYAVGWMIATRESGALAKKLIKETCSRQGIDPDQLTIHSDRGSPMKSKTVARLLCELGVAKSFNRPHVSNDNPYSESQFKTLKGHHSLPARFDNINDARVHCRLLLDWYNQEHYHSSIALMTPEAVHYGLAGGINQARQLVLNSAHAANPARFVKGAPLTIPLPEAAWINKPSMP